MSADSLFLFCLTEVRSEESRSSPSRRRKGEDSSTGELLPMPTSPGADLQSPAAQNTLFSSPPQMHSSGGSAVSLDVLTVAMMPKHSSVYTDRFVTETPGE